jgi:arginase family enzyme
MDILYYFEPVDFSRYYNSGHLNWKHTLGATIEKHTQSLVSGNTRQLQLAIVGVPFDSGNTEHLSTNIPEKIRTELYQLAKFDKKIHIVDFGNLKPASSVKGNYQALRDIIDYLNELKITTIVIGGSQDLSTGICNAFKANKFFSFSAIDAFLDVKKGKEPFNSSNFLSRVFSNCTNLFQFNLIGYQSHYLPTEYFKKINAVSSHLRLGVLRDNINFAEPVLRNTDFLSVDMKAVKNSDAPASSVVLPNGLESREICQLAKFAGLSNRLKVFGLFDVLEKYDRDDVTVKLSAQVLWYFLEGVVGREAENPVSQTSNTIYKVEVEGVDKPLIFIKNEITNRWWMQIETKANEVLNFACSEKEYQQASENEIPELWINYIQKIDQVLK